MLHSPLRRRRLPGYGIPVAPASDYMPGPYEPLMALQSMITRTDFLGHEWCPNQRITVAKP